MLKRDQHFLMDEHVLRRMADYAEIRKGEKILEIGAGTGNLTSFLVAKGGKVYAIEKDRDLFKMLEDEFSSSNCEIICGDALKMDLPDFDRVVSNLPYSISSGMTFKILEHNFSMGILTYQLEFARRLLGAVGSRDYGRLTIGVSYRATVEFLEKVSKGAFYPVPKVDSAIVRMVPGEPTFHFTGEANEKFFFKFVNAVFTQRRKKLKNAMRNTTHLFAEGKSMEEIFPLLNEKFKDYLELRPYELSPKTLSEISNLIYKISFQSYSDAGRT
jgi:dimethyladenosine transferase